MNVGDWKLQQISMSDCFFAIPSLSECSDPRKNLSLSEKFGWKPTTTNPESGGRWRPHVEWMWVCCPINRALSENSAQERNQSKAEKVCCQPDPTCSETLEDERFWVGSMWGYLLPDSAVPESEVQWSNQGSAPADCNQDSTAWVKPGKQIL